MNRLQAGFILLLLVFASCVGAFSVGAQPAGEVEAIGFNNQFRPGCWTPMLIRVKPGAEDTGTYQIQVFQEDMDRDRAIFTRTITLTGGSKDQHFWAYFLPQANKNGKYVGLPDTSQTATLAELQESLKVFLCNEKGKQLAQLPITASITNVDSVGEPHYRGTKFILFVTDGHTQPAQREFGEVAGLNEEVVFVPVPPFALPENVIGYDGIDGIVWSSAPPPDPAVPADEPRARALQQYVRFGGKLVICQSMNWQEMLTWGELLPVTYPDVGDQKGTAQKDDLQPLRDIGHPKNLGRDDTDWNYARGPFTFGIVDAKADARVDDWISWPKESGIAIRTPYLVRRPFGSGETIYVANDLGDPAINARAHSGWAWIWERVFDFKDDLKIYTDRTPDLDKKQYAPNAGLDFSAPLLGFMELKSTSAWLISIAVIFFIAYWLLAGPGTYFYLLRLKKSSLSWIAFGAAAVAAMFVTVIVVRLVLRGPPEMRHVTLVRIAPNTPAVCESKIGLYIKNDGLQTISLKNNSPDAVSYVSPYAIHPAQTSKDTSDFSSNFEYDVPVHDVGSAELAAINIPYRSTLKKLQTRWVGDLQAGISTDAALAPNTRTGITGHLTNASGQNLKNIYIVFSAPRPYSTNYYDFVWYFPNWKDGTIIDLIKDFPAKLVSDQSPTQTLGRPEDGEPLKGVIGAPGGPQDWDSYWNSNTRRNLPGEVAWEDPANAPPRSFPILSLFDRLGPVANNPGLSAENRIDRLRYAARNWDISSAVAAGSLVVLAQSDDNVALPYPLEVNGTETKGQGTVFYQFVLPLDRSKLSGLPTSQPSE